MTNSPLPTPKPPMPKQGTAANSSTPMVSPPAPTGKLPAPNQPAQLANQTTKPAPTQNPPVSQPPRPGAAPSAPSTPPAPSTPLAPRPMPPAGQVPMQAPRPASQAPQQSPKPPAPPTQPNMGNQPRPAAPTSAPKPGPRPPSGPASTMPPKITQPPRPGVTPPAPSTPQAPRPMPSAPQQAPRPAGQAPMQPPRPPAPPAGQLPPKPPGAPTQPPRPPAAPIPTQSPSPTPVPKPTPTPRPSMPPAPRPASMPPMASPAGMPPAQVGASPLPPSGPPQPPGPPKPPAPIGTPLPPTPPNSAAAPKMAAVRKSPLRFLPFIIGGLALLGLIIFLAMRFLGGGTQSVDTTPTSSGAPTRTTVPGQQTTLTYWGLWEPSDVLSDVFEEFEAANPGVSIVYTKQSPTDYRERLQTGIASGGGPDLFRFHASWTPMLKNELAPLPASVMSASEYQKTFYPVAYKQLQVNSQLVGVPLMYDGLALYYNKEMLRTANAQPPQTWADLRTLATQLTIRSGNEVQRAGLAVGNASNVEHFADVLALLMLQNGATFTNPTTPEARDALLFYTNFMKVDKVWSDTLPNSTTAFARGDVAMMFAPSWRAHEIKAQNPGLDFGIAPLPKLGDNKVTWATYWAEGVNTQSKNKDLAWKLIKFMSTPETMKKMYSAQSEVRTFGEPYSRVDLANDLASQPLVAPYLADAPTAEGWHLSSATHDNGINDQLIKYYQDAVNAILSGKDIEDVMATLNQGTAQVLRQYGVPTTTN